MNAALFAVAPHPSAGLPCPCPEEGSVQSWLLFGLVMVGLPALLMLVGAVLSVRRTRGPEPAETVDTPTSTKLQKSRAEKA